MYENLEKEDKSYFVYTGTNTNCTDGELRLRGGATSREGRVEMCYDRQWGTVCDDYWGTNDAKVACRQLGFSSYGIVVTPQDANYRIHIIAKHSDV